MKKEKIFVLCPATRRPSGGVKQLFQLVDNLNLLGYEAFLIRKSSSKAIKWFNHKTSIAYFPYLYFLINQLVKKKRKRDSLLFKLLDVFQIGRAMPPSDAIVVVPEIYAFGITEVLVGYKYVIFNQNCFLTFESSLPSTLNDVDPYLNEHMLGCVVVSDHSKRYLSLAYPNISVYRMHLGIKEMFSHSGSKRKQIAYMPRKLNEDSRQILQIIKCRNTLQGWSFIAIDNVSEGQVATILSESAIFLSFNHQEGLGLPPLEAMACGCYVIGYAGQSGAEYFLPEFSKLIPDRDIISFVQELEVVVEAYDSNPKELLEKGKQASAYVKNIYNNSNELKDTEAIWKTIFQTDF